MSLSRSSLLTLKARKWSMDWKSAWVMAWAICLLILSTPGVHVVRASDDLALARSGQTCGVASAEELNMSTDSSLERRRVRTVRPAFHPIYALNNRGFNYSPPTAPAPPPARPDAR